jgi:hypothetical protein
MHPSQSLNDEKVEPIEQAISKMAVQNALEYPKKKKAASKGINDEQRKSTNCSTRKSNTCYCPS